jgi:DNA-binding NtrC family response regulator
MTASILLLLVEDEELIRDLLDHAMTDAGFGLVMARSGAEALAELDANAARFRAVVTDIRLGAGPDGWEVARHARELVPEMPVVYMSGDSAANWAAQGVPHSVMVPKPFAVAQITTAVSTLLNATDIR